MPTLVGAVTPNLRPVSLRTTLLVVATVIVLVAMGFVVSRELTAEGRRQVGTVRDLVEVLLPAVAVAALLAAVWSTQ